MTIDTLGPLLIAVRAADPHACCHPMGRFQGRDRGDSDSRTFRYSLIRSGGQTSRMALNNAWLERTPLMPLRIRVWSQPGHVLHTRTLDHTAIVALDAATLLPKPAAAGRFCFLN